MPCPYSTYSPLFEALLSFNTISVHQAGTFGRFMGNMVLSMAARITRTNTVDEIINFSAVLFGTAAFWMAFSLAFVLATYRHLVG